MTQEEFYALLTEENAVRIADFILDNFGPSDELRLLDYDFNLKDGKMAPNKKANTSFGIDFPPAGIGRDIVSALADEKLEVTDDMRLAFMDFLEKIRLTLQNDAEKLNKKLAKAVMGREDITLKSVEIDTVLIMDLPYPDFTITVNKFAIKGYGSDAVTADLMEEHLLTNDDFDTILKRKKATGELRYLLIDNIVKKKAIFECECRFKIDYSFAE